MPSSSSTKPLVSPPHSLQVTTETKHQILLNQNSCQKKTFWTKKSTKSEEMNNKIIPNQNNWSTKSYQHFQQQQQRLKLQNHKIIPTLSTTTKTTTSSKSISKQQQQQHGSHSAWWNWSITPSPCTKFSSVQISV